MKRLLGRRKRVLRYVEHLDERGAEMFAHACPLGLEGIVSKRRDLGYRSGRSAAWLKIKNPDYDREGLVLTTRYQDGHAPSS
jgi:bifunctional non-homologous end joining protein LigD